MWSGLVCQAPRRIGKAFVPCGERLYFFNFLSVRVSPKPFRGFVLANH